jgi:hypothetical protein
VELGALGIVERRQQLVLSVAGQAPGAGERLAAGVGVAAAALAGTARLAPATIAVSQRFVLIATRQRPTAQESCALRRHRARYRGVV